MNRKATMRFALLFAVCLLLSFLPIQVLASEPVATIVSPSSDTVTGDGFIISVKVTVPKTIRVSVVRLEGEDVVKVKDPEVKEGTTKLWYYTDRLEKQGPGTYCITVETQEENNTYETAAAMTFTLKESLEKTQTVEIKVQDQTKNESAWKKLLQKIKNLFTK